MTVAVDVRQGVERWDVIRVLPGGEVRVLAAGGAVGIRVDDPLEVRAYRTCAKPGSLMADTSAGVYAVLEADGRRLIVVPIGQ